MHIFWTLLDSNFKIIFNLFIFNKEQKLCIIHFYISRWSEYYNRLCELFRSRHHVLLLFPSWSRRSVQTIFMVEEVHNNVTIGEIFEVLIPF